MRPVPHRTSGAAVPRLCSAVPFVGAPPRSSPPTSSRPSLAPGSLASRLVRSPPVVSPRPPRVCTWPWLDTGQGWGRDCSLLCTSPQMAPSLDGFDHKLQGGHRGPGGWLCACACVWCVGGRPEGDCRAEPGDPGAVARAWGWRGPGRGRQQVRGGCRGPRRGGGPGPSSRACSLAGVRGWERRVRLRPPALSDLQRRRPDAPHLTRPFGRDENRAPGGDSALPPSRSLAGSAQTLLSDP